MIYFINCSYSIGEPAQALPGFKGEIVSFQKKNILFRISYNEIVFFVSQGEMGPPGLPGAAVSVD